MTMHDLSAANLQRVGTIMAEVVARADHVSQRVEAIAAQERKRNWPLYGLLAAITISLAGIGYELHDLSTFLRSALNAQPSATQPQPPR